MEDKLIEPPKPVKLDSKPDCTCGCNWLQHWSMSARDWQYLDKSCLWSVSCGCKKYQEKKDAAPITPPKTV